MSWVAVQITFPSPFRGSVTRARTYGTTTTRAYHYEDDFIISLSGRAATSIMSVIICPGDVAFPSEEICTPLLISLHLALPRLATHRQGCLFFERRRKRNVSNLTLAPVYKADDHIRMLQWATTIPKSKFEKSMCL